jgi:hypothetical protein
MVNKRLFVLLMLVGGSDGDIVWRSAIQSNMSEDMSPISYRRPLERRITAVVLSHCPLSVHTAPGPPSP